MKSVLVLILFLTSCLPVYSSQMDGKAYLKKGKNELEHKKYEAAIASLCTAAKEFPLLGDYALFWVSDAYHDNGNHEESLNAVRSLLKKYPRSPLLKNSRIREINEAEEVSEQSVQKLYRSYIKDYPDDTEIRYSYARWLKNHDQPDKAKSIFKDIYIEAGPFSAATQSELKSSDLSAEDLVRRAANLIKETDFKSAESALKSAGAKDDGSLKKQILQTLGLSLFRQKKYHEAAEVYRKADERYWELRSLYRAGDKGPIITAVDELLKSRDKRMGSLLIAVASDRRREGDAGEAVSLYQNIMDRYPAEGEEALWGIGWTYFLTGEYKKASNVFARLHNSYNDPKYLYWKARSLEAAGDDPVKIYTAIMEKEHNFYSTLSYLRVKRFAKQSNGSEDFKFIKSITPVKAVPAVRKKIDRVEALLDIGLSKEALTEMIFISKNTDSIEDILYICSKLQELGDYKNLVKLAVKVPYKEELHSFLYPLAYRDTVEGLAKKYGIDPLLVLSVVREESRFDSDARSPAGALGLMQLMPKTAYRFDTKLKVGIDNSHDILNTKNNLHVGTYYLSRLVKEFGSYTSAVAAYNAGEEIVKVWLKKRNYKSPDEFIEDIPYSETRNYVKRVLKTFFEYKRITSTGDSCAEIPIEKL